MPAMVGSSQSSGHQVRISRSASAGSANRRNIRTDRRAPHRSAATSACRSPAGGCSRAWCRSYQPLNRPGPSSQARNWTSRIASSVSSSVSAVCGQYQQQQHHHQRSATPGRAWRRNSAGGPGRWHERRVSAGAPTISDSAGLSFASDESPYRRHEPSTIVGWLAVAGPVLASPHDARRKRRLRRRATCSSRSPRGSASCRRPA